ncbi:D-alanyl-D-alanine carboxypeptidase [Kocuria flava]|uniref:D-alanyl-D-alanine carboxypeptidase n=1 Tax=Kocuria flava TaxID=446860 RepID=UPI002F9422DE
MAPDPRSRPRARTPRVLAVLLALACAATAAWLHPHLAPAGAEVPAARTVPAGPPEPAGATRPDPGAPRPAAADVTAAVEHALTGVPAARRSVLVADALTGEPLAARDPDAALVPASNQKLVTLLSLLTHAGPGERLRTRVLAGDAPGTVVLTGGGDVLLGAGSSDPGAVAGRAGLRTLAERTAAALAGRGTTGPVTVRWDASLFPGPALNPAWADGDVAAGRIGPTTALALAGDTLGEGAGAADPAARAAAVLAAELDRLLPGGAALAPGPGPAPPGAAELAAVESAALAEQAELMVRESRNDLAEALGRVAAVAAGLPGSIEGARTAAERALAAHGIPAEGAVLSDASGMSLQDRLPARTLEHLVRVLVTDTGGRLAPGARALPVAGATGTLAARFDDPGEQAGRGAARAKTGTLFTVVSLSGHVSTRDGRLLTFAVLLDGVTDPAAARDAVDRAVAALADLCAAPCTAP